MLPDPEKEEWVAPLSTSGWAPCPSHSPLSSPEAPRAPLKKARMHLDSSSSMPSTSSGLGEVSTSFPFVNAMVKSLCPLFNSGTVDLKVDLRKVDTKVIWMTLMNVFKWTKDLENAKFLNANSIKKSSILDWYYTISKAFTSIRLYPKAPSPAPPSPKDADSPLPSQLCPPPPCPHPTAPAVVLVTSAAGITVGGSAWQKKKAVECSGTSRNIHAHADPPSPPPPVLHDMRPSGGKNYMHDSLASSARGPVVQRPGNCCRPFNTSNGPSR